MIKQKDITGQRVNFLVALRPDHWEWKKEGIGRHRKHYWLFRCDCGREKIMAKEGFSGRQYQSCGCLRGRPKIHDKEYYKQYAKEFRILHREDRRKVKRERKQKLEMRGSHSTLEWESLKASYDYCCLNCGRREPEIKLTQDHVIPLDKNGTNDISNIQPLCTSCNSHKRCKIADYRLAYPLNELQYKRVHLLIVLRRRIKKKKRGEEIQLAFSNERKTILSLREGKKTHQEIANQFGRSKFWVYNRINPAYFPKAIMSYK